MTTLFTAIFYLWLVLTILLAAMWILREQDRRRRDQQANALEEELLTGHATANVRVVPVLADEPAVEEQSPDPEIAESEGAEPIDADEPERAERTEAEPETAEPVAEDEPHDAEPIDEDKPDDFEPDDFEPIDEDEPEVAEPALEAQPEVAEAEPDPLPWGKSNRNRRKAMDNRRKPKQPRPRRQAGQPVAQPTESRDEQATEERTPPPPSAPAPEEPDTPRILAILDGVSLPYDLTPLTARIVDQDRHVILISTHGDAAEVGTAFADELVEQGFAIEPAGFDQALATRGDETISMRISPDAGTVTDGDRPRYPSANDTDVAIEVWLGNGSPPALAD